VSNTLHLPADRKKKKIQSSFYIPGNVPNTHDLILYSRGENMSSYVLPLLRQFQGAVNKKSVHLDEQTGKYIMKILVVRFLNTSEPPIT
jgi:hypothetical protein